MDDGVSVSCWSAAPTAPPANRCAHARRALHRLHTKRSDDSHDDVTVLPVQIQVDSRTRKLLIPTPDDEDSPGAGYEERAEIPGLEDVPGRVLLGHIMLTLLCGALMAAAIALCI